VIFTYGIEDYPDAQHKLIKPDNFALWLEQARKEGNVSVVITFKDPKKLAQLPRPEELVTNHRVAILTYEKRN
jgi:4-amino-4-deoxy-L-arabinose transferase